MPSLYLRDFEGRAERLVMALGAEVPAQELVVHVTEQLAFRKNRVEFALCQKLDPEVEPNGQSEFDAAKDIVLSDHEAVGILG